MSPPPTPFGRALAIINPFSAKGRARRAWPEISPTLRDAGLPFDEVTTPSPEEGMELAARAGGDGYAVVISAGGDGTTHWAVNGLMRSRTSPVPALAIIPEGTANDFPRGLHIPLNPRAAAPTVLDRTRRRVDIAQVNARYLATISGGRLDVAVA